MITAPTKGTSSFAKYSFSFCEFDNGEPQTEFVARRQDRRKPEMSRLEKARTLYEGKIFNLPILGQ